MNKAKLGGQEGAGSGRSKRSWRVKITRKLRLILSPKKLLIRLRDAYVNFMLRIENSNMMMMSRGGFGGADNISFGGRGPLKEYDEKMIIEIYKSMVVAQGLMVSRDAPNTVVTQIGLSSSVEVSK